MRRSESLLAAEGVSWGTMCKASALPSGWGEKGVEWTVGGWGHGAWGMVWVDFRGVEARAWCDGVSVEGSERLSVAGCGAATKVAWRVQGRCLGSMCGEREVRAYSGSATALCWATHSVCIAAKMARSFAFIHTESGAKCDSSLKAGFPSSGFTSRAASKINCAARMCEGVRLD